MKIAMLGHKRIPSREGGIEIVVEELATRMVEKGHQVTVYNRKGKNVADKSADLEAHKLKEYKGVKLVNVFTSEKKALNAILYSFNATWKAVFKKYDVIHFHAEGPCSMIPLAKLFGKRAVATIHGLDWARSKWGGFATKFLKFGEKMAAKHADEIIVLSKNVQNYFKETYGRDTHYIPNGVNLPTLKAPDMITKEYGLKGEDYILFLARLVPEKGLHYLLNAYREIDTDKKLVIAGGASHSSEYVDEIKALVARDERVIMTGFVQGQKLEELFSNAYVYVLPSDLEGMPISLLEALSYGRRCLVSDIDENVEAAKEYAVSFKKSDEKDLKEKLEGILRDSTLGGTYNPEAVRDYVSKNYNWDDVVEETLKLYKK